MTGLALLCGLLVIGGGLLAATGLSRVPVRERSPSRPREMPTPARVATIGGIALVALVLTRWPVAAIAAGVAAALLSGSRSALGRRTEEADMAEALTAWAEMLRDATGTPRGIEGVLVATAPGAPALIRPAVARVAQRLPYDPLDVALDDLADDLAHPVGDLVVTALRLAASSGGRQIRSVLDDLATVAREEARMHRRVEVARARPGPTCVRSSPSWAASSCCSRWRPATTWRRTAPPPVSSSSRWSCASGRPPSGRWPGWAAPAGSSASS